MRCIMHYHLLLPLDGTDGCCAMCRRWVGYDSDKEKPLKDPEHPFNTAYSHVSSRVLDGPFGHLLNLD